MKMLFFFVFWQHLLFAQKQDTVLINGNLAIPNYYFSLDTTATDLDGTIIFQYLLYHLKKRTERELKFAKLTPYFLVYKKRLKYNPVLFKSGIFYIYQNLPDSLKKRHYIAEDTCNAEILYRNQTEYRIYPMSEEIINNYGFPTFWHFQVKMKCIRVGETSIPIFNEHYNPKCKKSKKWFIKIVPQYYIVKILYFRPLYPTSQQLRYYKDEYRGENSCN